MFLISALILGLLGSLHCAGMCGPIALSITLIKKTVFTKIVGGILYNLGRIFTYSFMGLIFGFLGTGISMFGFQKILSVVAGIVMLLSGLFLAFRGNFGAIERISFIDRPFIRKMWIKLFSKPGFGSLFLIGVLNGFLPCGLVYMALAGALYTGSLLNGTLYMFAFGLGSAPMLLLILLVGNYISVNLRQRIYKIVPYYIVVLGLVMIVRGMGLGIPYLSPAENKLVPKQQSEKTMMKGDCCKKK